MVIRGSRKLLIKQLDTSLIQENFLGARRRDAHQIGPRVMVFDADRVFAHGILQGDLSSLPYKTVRHVLSSLWLSTNCRMLDSASRLYADPYKPESTRKPKPGRQSADGMESVPGAVATGSQLTHDQESRSRYPVATATGTDLILKIKMLPESIDSGGRASNASIPQGHEVTH